MNSTVDIPPVKDMDAEAFDVIIIGAGLSYGTAVRLGGIADRDFILLERRDAIAAWICFGISIRSDSDMHTLGYDFNPGSGKKYGWPRF